jgi:hypothetical protein
MMIRGMGRKSREKAERRAWVRPPRSAKKPYLTTEVLPTPTFGIADIRMALDGATAFLGEATVRALVGGMKHGQRVFPWTPALRWWLDQPDRLDAVPMPGVLGDVAMVVRDFSFLKSLHTVWTIPDRRRAARDRLLQEPASALWELRAAGTYAIAGVAAEWSAVTRATEPGVPDVELPSFGIHIEVKTRVTPVAPMANESRVLSIIDAAGRDLGGRRAGVVIMSVPGIRDWTPWQISDSAGSFKTRLRAKFYQSPFGERVAAVVLAGDPHLAGDGKTFSYAAWVIGTPHIQRALPASVPVFSAWA